MMSVSGRGWRMKGRTGLAAAPKSHESGRARLRPSRATGSSGTARRSLPSPRPRFAAEVAVDSIDDIYLNARELTDAAERARYLDAACGSNAALRERLNGMLRDAAGAEAFFGPLQSGAAAYPGLGGVGDAPGARIGRYTLLEKLGEGGMGVVYRAEQQEPVRRQVALKIIKLGMDTRQVVARFEAERQALALMDHPNIAKVLDGGTTGGSDRRSVTSNQRSVSSDQLPADGGRRTTGQPPITDDSPLVTDDCSLVTVSGRPYFVMELVEGEPITAFCGKHELSLEQRLRLFIPVCQAVQHAHQKGIIHRDLKPSNVMVTVQDGVPVPRVIDFGVAKAINQRLTEKTVFTQHATLIGTPAYMSPEQAELSGLDVDTRSDIYSLGVLLYELLTGTQPFPEERLRSMAYAEMQRILLHEEPERPSTRLTRTMALGGARGSRAVFGGPSRTPFLHAPVGTGDREGQASGEPPKAAREPRALPRRESGTSREPRALPGEVRTAVQALRGDLDWIVLKCLEKDRNRRYETANGLAADLQRFLNNEPVVARPPTAVYRLQKAVRRNRLAFAAAGAVGLSLLAGIAATSWQAVRAGRESRRASQEQARAEHRLHATVQLLGKTFTNVMPELRMTIGATKPREELALAASEIADELLQDTEPNPEVRWILGELYLQLAMVQGYYSFGPTTAEYDKALESARKAIRFFQPVASGQPSDEGVERLIWAEMTAGFAGQGLLRFDDALDHFEKMRSWSLTLARSTNRFLADRALEKIGWARYLTGETLLRMGLAELALTNYFLPNVEDVESRQNDPRADRQVALEDLRDSRDAVGRAYLRLGQRDQAEGWFRLALPAAETLTDRYPSHAGYAVYAPQSKARLAEVLLALARPDEALPLFDSATQSAEMLQKRDPGNPGFVQLQVEILQCHATGYAGWAEEPGAPAAERALRLDRAEAYLDQAEGLVAALKSEPFRTFLCDGLLRTEAELQTTRGRLGLSRVVPSQRATLGNPSN